MSVRATNWAWEKGRELDLNQGQRLTLVRIGDHADNDGVCWPGEEGLSDYTGADESTVRRHLKAFQELGLLHREHRVRGEGSGRGRAPDLICLHMDAADQPGKTRGRSSSDQPVSTPGKSAQDQPGKTRGRSGGTNRASEGGPTGHSTPDQPGISPAPYIEEPSGTVSEPSPPDPPMGGKPHPPTNGRRRDHDRYADDLIAFHESLEVAPEAEAAWSAALKTLAGGLPAATRALWIDPHELIGDLNGELYLTAPLPVCAWIERKYRDALEDAVGDDYGVVVLPTIERAVA